MKLTKQLSSILLSTLMLILLASFYPNKDPLLGKWRNDKYGVEVVIFKNNNLYHGLVTEAGNKKGNEKIKKEPMQVLSNFKKTSDSTYCCGNVYLPKARVSIKSDIELLSPTLLKVVGHWMGIKTESFWKKI